MHFTMLCVVERGISFIPFQTLFGNQHATRSVAEGIPNWKLGTRNTAYLPILTQSD